MRETLLQSEGFDVLVVDRFAWAGFEASDKMKSKVVVDSPEFLVDFSALRAPAFHDSSVHTTFWSVVWSQIRALAYQLEVIRFCEYFEIPVDLLRTPESRGIVLAHSMPGFDVPRKLSKSIHFIGIPFPESKPELSPEISKFLDHAFLEGVPVMYVYIGDLALIPEEMLSQFQEALLLAHEFKFIWSTHYNSSSLSSKVKQSSQVMLVDWVSQISALEHPAVSCFISHCGVRGVQEAAYLSKHVLCVPMFSDQWDNGLRLLLAGTGIVRSFHSLDSVQFAASIKNIHDKASDNVPAATRLSKLVSFRNAIEAAVNLIEVALDPNYPADHASASKSFRLDVAIFFLLMIAILSISSHFVFQYAKLSLF
jgi:hypothetical protein